MPFSFKSRHMGAPLNNLTVDMNHIGPTAVLCPMLIDAYQRADSPTKEANQISAQPTQNYCDLQSCYTEQKRLDKITFVRNGQALRSANNPADQNLPTSPLWKAQTLHGSEMQTLVSTGCYNGAESTRSLLYLANVSHFIDGFAWRQETHRSPPFQFTN